jgi:hypothetical protein
VLLGSIVVRRPLVGVIAEFLAPSHLGGMSGHRLPSLRSRVRAERAVPVDQEVPDRGTPDAPAERHWREDRRMLRAYGWLTVLWGGVFLLRAVVQWVLYLRDAVGLLGTSSLVLGLPLTAVELLVTLWVVSRLHRHRAVEPDERPAG